jgi:hypothetical protein
VSECCCWNFGLDWSRSFLHNSISHAKSSQKHIASSFSLNSISRPKCWTGRNILRVFLKGIKTNLWRGTTKLKQLWTFLSNKSLFWRELSERKIWWNKRFLAKHLDQIVSLFNVHNFVLNNCCKISHFGISICYLELRKKMWKIDWLAGRL